MLDSLPILSLLEAFPTLFVSAIVQVFISKTPDEVLPTMMGFSRALGCSLVTSEMVFSSTGQLIKYFSYYKQDLKFHSLMFLTGVGGARSSVQHIGSGFYSTLATTYF